MPFMCISKRTAKSGRGAAVFFSLSSNIIRRFRRVGVVGSYVCPISIFVQKAQLKCQHLHFPGRGVASLFMFYRLRRRDFSPRWKTRTIRMCVSFLRTPAVEAFYLQGLWKDKQMTCTDQQQVFHL